MEDLLTSEAIAGQLREVAENLVAMSRDTALHDNMARVAEVCIAALKRGHKILFAGNGGSAADSQHLAGELLSRFNYDRPGLPAFALSTDTSCSSIICRRIEATSPCAALRSWWAGMVIKLSRE